MAASGTPPGRVVRGSLLLLAGLFVGYALSDHPLYGGEPGFGRLQAVITMIGIVLGATALLPLRWAERALVVVVSGLLMLGVAELLANALLGPIHRPIFTVDERVIFKLVPDRSSAMRHLPANGGGQVVHRINSQGFRGPELLPARAATRVVVYGDSFIHAGYAPEDETFAAVLGELLSTPDRQRVEVVNAGVSSYGPDQIALKMADELPRLQPDLVVVSVFAGNDYGDLLRNKLFRLAPDGTLRANAWELDPAIRRRLDISQTESILVRALRSALGGLRSGDAGAGGGAAPIIDWNFLLEEAEREYRSFVVDGDNRVVNTHVDYYSADVALTPNADSARYKVALMQATLARIKDVARQHGVALVFLFIPHPNDVATDYDFPPVDRARYPDYDGRNQIAPLEATATALGVPFVSLYDPFRSVDTKTLYLRGGDDHWNAAGQRKAAGLMADKLRPLLPRQPARISP